MRNLTPHAIKIVSDAGVVIAEFPPSGATARLVMSESSETETPVGVPGAWAARPTGVEGLDAAGDVVVSSFVGAYVAQHCPNYAGQVWSPDTGPLSAVRDENGRIVGVQRLQRWL